MNRLPEDFWTSRPTYIIDPTARRLSHTNWRNLLFRTFLALLAAGLAGAIGWIVVGIVAGRP